jgi:hypothetical protein
MEYNKSIMSLPHQRMYLMNTSKDIVVRSLPGRMSKFYAKQRGGKEIKLHHLDDILQDTLREAKKITRKDYAFF